MTTLYQIKFIDLTLTLFLVLQEMSPTNEIVISWIFIWSI